MIPILSRAQVRAYDTHAIEQLGIPGVLLMENAGRGAADVIAALLARAPGGLAAARVVVVAGTGNNGGDGFVVARHLAARGVDVAVVLCGRIDRVAGDARTNLEAWRELGGVCTALPSGTGRAMIDAEIAEATLIVDALFGTGLDRAIEGTFADAVAAMNDAAADVVALDLPSGLDADTGVVLGAAVAASATITFAHRKLGLCTPRGAELAGEVSVADLGLPDGRVLEAVGVAARGLTLRDAAPWLATRRAGVHKHAAGDVLVIAGGAGTTGAALLAARGALRAGAGLATIATFPEARAALDLRVVEIMTRAIDPEDLEGSLDHLLAKRTAVVLGPGFGTGDLARRAIEHVVSTHEGLLVLDADGITCFAGRPEDLAAAAGDLVLTPHPGELGRLLGRPSAEIEADRFAAAQEAAERTRSVVVLKGAHTIVAGPEGSTWVALDRAPALATAGSGDVLAGILAGLATGMATGTATGLPTGGAGAAPRSMRAAAAAVLVHAGAALLWSSRHGGSDRGLLAGEIADLVPEVMVASRR